jgi:hypothetical protein
MRVRSDESLFEEKRGYVALPTGLAVAEGPVYIRWGSAQKIAGREFPNPRIISASAHRFELLAN